MSEADFPAAMPANGSDGRRPRVRPREDADGDEPTAELDSARAWVLGLTAVDAGLEAERLHATFMAVVFEGAGGSDDGSGSDDGDGAAGEARRRFKTAAEREAKAEMQAELADLLDTGGADGDDGGVEPSDDGSSLADDDDSAAGGDGALDADDVAFQRWIGADEGFGVSGGAAAAAAQRPGVSAAAVARELAALGLSGATARAAERDAVPERLAALRDAQAGVAGRRSADESADAAAAGDGWRVAAAPAMPGGTSVELLPEMEACWVLRQLTRPGQPFADSATVGALVAQPAGAFKDDPRVAAVAYVLHAVRHAACEPASLMLHHQTPLMPLLRELWSEATLRTAEVAEVAPSLGYCVETGRRQTPCVSTDGCCYQPLLTTGHHDIGFGDPLWGPTDTPGRRVRRKPAAVELGRLCWAIAELGVECAGYERARHALLHRLRGLGEPRLASAIAALEATVFDTGFDVAAWTEFAAYAARLAAGPAAEGALHSAQLRVAQLGLETALGVFGLSPEQYDENMREGAAVHVPSDPRGMEPEEWARSLGEALPTQRSADAVLGLLREASAEALAALPELRCRVFDFALRTGAFHVWPLTAIHATQPSAVSILSLLEANPMEYLALRAQADARAVSVKLHVDTAALLESVICLHVFYSPYVHDAWGQQRALVGPLLAQRLIRGVERHIDDHLRRIATRVGARQAALHMAMTACSLGPYEPTRLAVTGFDPRAATWDAAWNVVEALPVVPTPTNTDASAPPSAAAATAAAGEARGLASVCGAYRHDNNVTVFVCIDRNGGFAGSLRWIDCAENDPEGKRIADAQRRQLLALCARCAPSVFAVGAAEATGAPALLRSVSAFVEKDWQPVAPWETPVVWVSLDVARARAWSRSAQDEMSCDDVALLAALSLARFVQHPLFELCRLFTPERDALRLPLGAGTPLLDPAVVYTALEREVSLWVTATGVDVNAAMARYGPESALQFVAGLGPRRARLLSGAIAARRAGVVRSRAQLASLLDTFVCAAGAAEAESRGADPRVLFSATHNALPSLRVSRETMPASAVTDFSGGGGGFDEDADNSDNDTDGNGGERPAPHAVPETLRGPHPLDGTLVPPAWYPAAELLALRLLRSVPLPAVPSTFPASPAAVALLLALPEPERYRIAAAFNPRESLALFAAAFRFIGERELDFIVDEFLACGRSFLARPYRRLTNRHVMELLSGVRFGGVRGGGASAARPAEGATGVAASGAAAAAAADVGGDATDSAAGSAHQRTVFLGDVVQSSVLRVEIKPFERLRLATSRGLVATMREEDMADAATKAQFRGAVEWLAQQAAERDKARAEGRPRAPQGGDNASRDALDSLFPLVAKGRCLHGEVIGVNYSRLELSLRQCPAPAGRLLSAAKALQGGGHGAAALDTASVVSGEGGAGRLSGQSQASIFTQHLVRAARVHAANFSHHDLFRHMDGRAVERLLHDKPQGEALLRPSRDRRNEAIVCVKVGEFSIMSLALREDRGADGKFVYSVTDSKVGRRWAFSDVDHCMHAYVDRVVAHVESLREHRRFCPSLDTVRQALEQQRADNPDGVAYCFLENPAASSDGRGADRGPSGQVGHHYILSYLPPRAAAPREAPLHITADGIYVQDPFQRETYLLGGTAEGAAAAFKVAFVNGRRAMLDAAAAAAGATAPSVASGGSQPHRNGHGGGDSSRPLRSAASGGSRATTASESSRHVSSRYAD